MSPANRDATTATFSSLMELEPHGPDVFVGTGPDYPWGGLYGGQIIAQGLRAAGLTVEPDYGIHSVHAYFIRAGSSKEPIRYEVDRIRNGRTFVTRRVVARQALGAILNLSASFQVAEEGAHVQTATMPEVPPAESLKEDSWFPLFERRMLRDDEGRRLPKAWFRMGDSLGDDPVVHAAALAYLSDDLPTDAVITLHPERPPPGSHGRFWNASLDHAMWFHRPVRADDWHLHHFWSDGLVGSRGMSLGHIFRTDGTHVATVSQEVLIRTRR